MSVDAMTARDASVPRVLITVTRQGFPLVRGGRGQVRCDAMRCGTSGAHRHAGHRAGPSVWGFQNAAAWAGGGGGTPPAPSRPRSSVQASKNCVHMIIRLEYSAAPDHAAERAIEKHRAGCRWGAPGVGSSGSRRQPPASSMRHAKPCHRHQKNRGQCEPGRFFQAHACHPAAMAGSQARTAP